MDEDDLPKPKGPLADLVKEDLSPMGVEELSNRIEALKAEISRTEAAISARSSTRAAAEAVFGG